MRFTKMHGCGNDYLYVNGFEEHVPQEEKPQLARRLSDRHFGVGGDGVIFINPSEEADFEMEMYNADGSRSQMCGNGIRCVAKFVYDKGLTDAEHITVVSAGSVKHLDLTVARPGAGDAADRLVEKPAVGDMAERPGRKPEAEDTAAEPDGKPHARGAVTLVRVDMGRPILEPERIPVVADGVNVVNEPIYVGEQEYRMTCVSMGNPHAVVFTEGVRDLKLEQIGPLFENHVRFPERVNTEFVEIIDRRTVFMRVWERGTGETLACGTGCCATAVACVLNGLTEECITVKLLGGELRIEWDRQENTIYMTGPAATVFEGEVDLCFG